MIALIPAKSKSNRLKNKNLKKVNGKSLIEFTFQKATQAKYISQTFVSSDSKKICSLAENYNIKSLFLRPIELCKPNTTLIEVAIHFLKFFEFKFKRKLNELIILQPTSPLRSTIDINKSIILFKRKKADLVISVTKSKPPQWITSVGKNFKIKYDVKKSKNNNYIYNGAIYIFSRKYIFNFKKKNKKKLKTFAYIMPSYRSVDIDFKEDFEMFRRILNNESANVRN